MSFWHLRRDAATEERAINSWISSLCAIAKESARGLLLPPCARAPRVTMRKQPFPSLRDGIAIHRFFEKEEHYELHVAEW
jgi:hypothetical protein